MGYRIDDETEEPIIPMLSYVPPKVNGRANGKFQHIPYTQLVDTNLANTMTRIQSFTGRHCLKFSRTISTTPKANLMEMLTYLLQDK
jgi:hypothetical protein